MSNYFGTVEEVAAARAKRRSEVQEWARQDQQNADSLLGVPATFDQDWDVILVAPEEEEEEEVEEVSTPIVEVTIEATNVGVSESETPVETPQPKTAKNTRSRVETSSKD